MKYDVYFQPTEDDYKQNPFLASQFKDTPSFKTNKMPKIPINPSTLSSKVITYLKEYGNVIANGTAEQLESFCKLFNWVISHKPNEHNFRFVHDAQTGSAKSLSLKVYISLLEKESSLIVVSKVDEAIEYCKFINEQSNNQDYARCYFTVTDKNKDSEFRVENVHLKNYRCIVISHSMFKRLNQGESLNSYKLYNNNERNLVVIDEKINFYDSTIVTYSEIDKLVSYFNYIQVNNETDDTSPSIFDKILFLFKLYQEFHLINKHKSFTTVDFVSLAKDFKITQDDLVEQLAYLETTVCKRLNILFEELSYISKISDHNHESSVSNNVKELIRRIRLVLSENFIYHQSNYEKSLIRVDNIVNKLGNCVILDATANVNEFYKIATKHGSSIAKVISNPIRRYSNLTIYKAIGYRQGRSSTYKGKSKKQAVINAKIYISYIKNILTSKKDNLLIITHKGFKKYLMEQCSDTRVQFTHWGDHIGRNDWSNCNKVMVIGWNFINKIDHICSAFNAVDDFNKASLLVTDDVIQNFSTKQIADDIIQGVMRSQARKTATITANCEPTDIYLYYEDTTMYNDVLNIIESYFPEVNIKNWIPIGIERPKTNTKPQQKADIIINYLQDKESTHPNILLIDIIKDLEMNKSTVSRIINSEYFKTELDKKGYKCKNTNGRSKYFILA